MWATSCSRSPWPPLPCAAVAPVVEADLLARRTPAAVAASEPLPLQEGRGGITIVVISVVVTINITVVAIIRCLSGTKAKRNCLGKRKHGCNFCSWSLRCCSSRSECAACHSELSCALIAIESLRAAVPAQECAVVCHSGFKFLGLRITRISTRISRFPRISAVQGPV